MRNKRSIFFLAAVLILQYLFVSSCGYRVYRTSELPYSSLRIGSVTNHTDEPGLQDLFVRVFTEEALKQGITVSEDSDNIISVDFSDYRLKPVATKDDLSAEYEIRVVADIKIQLHNRPEIEIKGLDAGFSEIFITTGTSETLQTIQSNREVTTRKALKDLSQRIISEIVYIPGKEAGKAN
jgi:hypothetical protein